jgi:hypothetical protein
MHPLALEGVASSSRSHTRRRLVQPIEWTFSFRACVYPASSGLNMNL